MTKPTKTAEELKTAILEAADPKREYLNVRVFPLPNGTWGMTLSGSSLPQTMIDLANQKQRDLAQQFDLASATTAK